MSKPDKKPRRRPGLSGNAIVSGIGVAWECGGDRDPTPAQHKDERLNDAVKDVIAAVVRLDFPLPFRLTFLPAALAGPPDDLLPPTRN